MTSRLPHLPAEPLRLEDLYRQHAPEVARWAGRLSGPGLDVEDLVHEVFCTVHRLLPGFRGEARMTTWLYRITANVVRDRRRQERRRWHRVMAWFCEGQSAEPAPTPAEALERRQAGVLLYRLLDELREEHRTVLILFELEGMSGEAIAELMNTQLNTVWVWLHRARAELRQRLQAQALREAAAGAEPALLNGLRPHLAVARKPR